MLRPCCPDVMTDNRSSLPLKTHEDLAERLNLPLSTIVGLRKREGWPHIKLGRAIRFTEEHIEQIIASHTVAKEPAATPMFPGMRPTRARSARPS